jgi:hypothetical protein
VRWLIDEMFPAEVATELAGRGHDARAAVHGLRGWTDEQLLELAWPRLVLWSPRVVDFVRLLQDRTATGGAVTPVVFVLKSNLPRDPARLGRTLADRLDAWTDDHPDPFPTAYWL